MKLDDISNQLSTKVSIVHFECFAQAALEYGDVTEAPQTNLDQFGQGTASVHCKCLALSSSALY